MLKVNRDIEVVYIDSFYHWLEAWKTIMRCVRKDEIAISSVHSNFHKIVNRSMVGQRGAVELGLVFFTTLVYTFVDEHFRTVICDTLSQHPFMLSLLVDGNAWRITIHLRLHRRSTGICCVTSFTSLTV